MPFAANDENAIKIRTWAAYRIHLADIAMDFKDAYKAFFDAKKKLVESLCYATDSVVTHASLDEDDFLPNFATELNKLSHFKKDKFSGSGCKLVLSSQWTSSMERELTLAYQAILEKLNLTVRSVADIPRRLVYASLDDDKINSFWSADQEVLDNGLLEDTDVGDSETLRVKLQKIGTALQNLYKDVRKVEKTYKLFILALREKFIFGELDSAWEHRFVEPFAADMLQPENRTQLAETLMFRLNFVGKLVLQYVKPHVAPRLIQEMRSVLSAILKQSQDMSASADLERLFQNNFRAASRKLETIFEAYFEGSTIDFLSSAITWQEPARSNQTDKPHNTAVSAPSPFASRGQSAVASMKGTGPSFDSPVDKASHIGTAAKWARPSPDTPGGRMDSWRTQGVSRRAYSPQDRFWSRETPVEYAIYPTERRRMDIVSSTESSPPRPCSAAGNQRRPSPLSKEFAASRAPASVPSPLPDSSKVNTAKNTPLLTEDEDSSSVSDSENDLIPIYDPAKSEDTKKSSSSAVRCVHFCC